MWLPQYLCHLGHLQRLFLGPPRKPEHPRSPVQSQQHWPTLSAATAAGPDTLPFLPTRDPRIPAGGQDEAFCLGPMGLGSQRNQGSVCVCAICRNGVPKT